VRRSSPAAGCTGRGEKERKKKEDLLAESTDQNCMLYLNKSQAQFCGRSPRERVNHVCLVLCVCD
jgi:hypothetical protein